MKRIGSLVAIVFFCFLTISTAHSGPIEIKFSYNGPPDMVKNPNHAYGSIFKRIVEMDSGNKFKIVLYHSSQLGEERDRLDQLKSGICHINVASVGGLSQIYPKAYLFFIPYLFSGYEAAWEVVDNSQFMKDYKQDLLKTTGLVLLDPIEVGEFLIMTNNKRPIKEIEDVKGIKFRGMDPGQVAFYKALGGSGTPIPWSEVYTSLQTGVVDGQTNPPAIIIWGKLFEVQKYATLTRHMYGVQYSLANRKWFEGLSPEDRQIFQKAHRIAGLSLRGLIQMLETQDLEYLAQNGMELYQPTEAQFRKFKSLGQPAYLEWLSEKVDKAWIEKISAAAAEAEAALKKK